MRYWKAHYKDALHDTDIEIVNTEEDYRTEPLSFILDNITFCGTSPGDFHLADETQYGITMCDDVRVYRDDVIVREFSLSIDGVCYKSSKRTLYFEAALNDICGQIKDDYYIKCCFTCQYSDYSPYGNDDYGLMLCFCRHKDDCLRVNNKDDFFSFLEGKDFDGRQETYLCEQYCPRNRAGGYRGFVDGVMD